MDTTNIVSIILTCVIVLLTAIYFRFRRPPGFPPGPPFFPGVGTAAFVACPASHGDLIGLLNSWRLQFGKVCGFSTGDRSAVVINEYEVAKEVFIRDGKYVSDRARLGFAYLKQTNPYYPRTGVLGGDYSDDKWRPLQRACQMALHELVDIPLRGHSTSRLEGRLARPLDALIGSIDLTLKTANDVVPLVTSAITQFVLSVLFGGDRKETASGAEQLRRLREPLTAYTDHLHLKQNHTYHLLDWVTGATRELSHAHKNMHSFLFSQLGEHQTRQKKDQLQAHDFIDYYLRECAKNGVTSDNRLFLVLNEITEHGIDPLVSVLTCVIYFLVSRPGLQVEIQEKLDTVVGQKRSPRLKDRASLGVIDAVVNETLRLAPPYVVGEPHRTCSKMEADGHVLPRDTMVYLNIWQIHRDPKIWSEASSFKPERFLNPHGRFVNRHQMVPFGLGRRTCPGEQTSRQLLFLTVANLLQKFTFVPPEGDSIPETLGSGACAPTYRPRPFKVCAIRRR